MVDVSLPQRWIVKSTLQLRNGKNTHTRNEY